MASSPPASLSKRPLTVLLVEPDEVQAHRIKTLLEEGGEAFSVHHSWDLHRALERLTRGGVDVVLLDLELPDSRGLATFERMFAFAPSVPIVVLTELEDDGLSLAAVQGGAQDYLVHHELTAHVLFRSLRYAVERHRLLSALRSLSLIDDLTGLYNRRGFGDLGEQYLKLARRTGQGVTLIFLDIDRFKTINDILGHHMGDRALVRIADILRSTFRGSDILARTAGDEFAVLAPEASGDPPEVLAHRIRGAVQVFNETSKDPFRLSVSIGSCRYTGDATVRLDDLLAEADAAMCDEKRSKKRVVQG